MATLHASTRAPLSDCLTKVPSREFSPGSCLGISLESNCRLFVVELDTDQHSPWSISRRVSRSAFIVGTQPCHWIGRQADVVLVGVGAALEDTYRFNAAIVSRRTTIGPSLSAPKFGGTDASRCGVFQKKRDRTVRSTRNLHSADVADGNGGLPAVVSFQRAWSPPARRLAAARRTASARNKSGGW